MRKSSNCADSVTNVHMEGFDKNVSIDVDLSGKRGSHGVRVNDELFARAKKAVARYGFSLCHVIEPALLAFCEGKAVSRVAPVVIENLNVTRLVTRARRNPRGVEFPYCEVTWCGRYGYFTLEDREGDLHYFCKSHSKMPQVVHGWRLVEK
jgi:hypothetical protein